MLHQVCGNLRFLVLSSQFHALLVLLEVVPTGRAGPQVSLISFHHILAQLPLHELSQEAGDFLATGPAKYTMAESRHHSIE